VILQFVTAVSRRSRVLATILAIMATLLTWAVVQVVVYQSALWWINRGRSIQTGLYVSVHPGILWLVVPIVSGAFIGTRLRRYATPSGAA
jgi:hypothetical protein